MLIDGSPMSLTILHYVTLPLVGWLVGWLINIPLLSFCSGKPTKLRSNGGAADPPVLTTYNTTPDKLALACLLSPFPPPLTD